MKAITPQAFFDAALFGMRRQNYVQSVNADGACLYRGPDGLKCGVGHSLPDHMYDIGMEAGTFENTLGLFPDVQAFYSLVPRELGSLVQEAHDNAVWTATGKNTHKFEWAMESVAKDHNLVYTPVESQVVIDTYPNFAVSFTVDGAQGEEPALLYWTFDQAKRAMIAGLLAEAECQETEDEAATLTHIAEDVNLWSTPQSVLCLGCTYTIKDLNP